MGDLGDVSEMTVAEHKEETQKHQNVLQPS